MAGRAAGRGSGRGPCPDDGRGRSARGDRRVGRGASASVSADTPGTPWPIRILHLHSSFSLGGKEARAVRLMNLMGDRAHHSILSAMPGALGARDAIDPAIIVDFPKDAPPLHGKPSLGRYRDLANYMTRFDLVLSYNWGALEDRKSTRLFSRVRPDRKSVVWGMSVCERVDLGGGGLIKKKI